MVAGLEDMASLLTSLVEASPDGLLVRPATLKQYASLLARRGGPGSSRRWTRDDPSVPGGEVMGEEHVLVTRVEGEAVALGADAVKVLLIFGRKNLPRAHVERETRGAGAIQEAERLGVPVMVETVLWGLSIPKERRARIGADSAHLPHRATGAGRGQS